MSATPRCGTSSGPSPSLSTATIVRISASVRDASSSIKLEPRTALSGRVAATVSPACAWIAIAET